MSSYAEACFVSCVRIIDSRYDDHDSKLFVIYLHYLVFETVCLGNPMPQWLSNRKEVTQSGLQVK